MCNQPKAVLARDCQVIRNAADIADIRGTPSTSGMHMIFSISKLIASLSRLARSCSVQLYTRKQQQALNTDWK